MAAAAVKVPGNAPVVTIHNPRGRGVLALSQVLVLDGSAEDIEDGQLKGAALQWSSSLDGVLGTGEQLVLGAEALSAGSHQITLTATDTDGTKGLEIVEVDVQ